MRPSDRRRSRAHTARLEAFEPRLFLSAVPAYDFWLDNQHLPETGHYADVNPATTHAHALTGLDYARAAYGFTGAGQTVAVIDTGIAYLHDALGGGYGPGYRVVGGWDFTNNSADAFDTGPYGSHGTHVAGIIGSSDSVHTGVAPEVDLVALRVFDDNGGGTFAWVEQALWWVHANRFAFENPITAVNLSLGTSYNAASIPSWATLEDALAQLRADGIFISVAAGNSFAHFNAPGLSYPAASPHVVAVGSVDANGALSSFSQRHTRMIAAPGRDIMSTVPDYMGNYNGIHDDFARYSGTSMAAPYVAGASVVLREAYAFAGVEHVSQDALYDLMYSTADTFFDAASQRHYKRLNLQAAVDAVMPADDYGSTVHTAHAMGNLTGTLSLTGHISRLDDVDWFQFTAGGTGTVTVTATPTLNLTPKWSTDGFAAGTSNGGNSLTFQVVAGKTYRFSLATANGLGRYTLHAGLNAPAHPGTLADVQFADVTGNGLADIVGRSAHDGSWWVAVNQGNGSFTNQHWGRWSTAVTWVDVVVGDFNGNGRDDIAGRVAETGDWWVALSNGSGGFTNQRFGRWSPHVAWTDVVVGDFNGNGRDDIAGRVAGSGDWWVALSNGSGGFTNQRYGRWSTTVTWTDVVVGDFNGNGRDDIAGRVVGSGDWWVALSNGSSGFTNQRYGRWSTTVTWTDVVVGDFNGDGRDDIAGRVAENGDWWVAKGNGTNAFTNERWGRWSSSVTWTDVVVGDFSGNGRTDIAGRVGTNGDWWLAKSNGVNAFANERWGPTLAPPGWEHVVVGNHAPTAAPLHTAAATWGSRAVTSSTLSAALSPWQLDAFATLAGPSSSPASPWFAGSGPFNTPGAAGLTSGPARNDSIATDGRLAGSRFDGFGQADLDKPIGRAATRPGSDAIDRMELLLAVLNELDDLPEQAGSGYGLIRSALAPGSGWMPFVVDPPQESSHEEASPDPLPSDTANLDAFYASLA